MDTCNIESIQKLEETIYNIVYENYTYSLEAHNHDPLAYVYYYVLSWMATMDTSSVQETESQ